MTKDRIQDYQKLQPDELVNLFADKHQRNSAISALIGGLTASELRRVRLTDKAFEALVKGLEHPNPKVRWWCLQIFDHVADERCVPHIIKALDDPIPRVARHAQHALECEICKQSPAAALAVREALAQRETQQLNA